MEKTLVVMAAGMGSRFGGLKQIEPVGPNGEFIIDYSIYDAKRAGFTKVVFVIKKELEQIFRDTIGKRIEKFIDVSYAFQEINDVPSNVLHLVEKREKPWGTAQAVYVAKDLVPGDFIVINADDFYGRDAYIQASHFLDVSTDPFQYACITYPFNKVSSKHGSVKRGVCFLENDNIVKMIESSIEMKGDQALATPLVSGEAFLIESNHPVSMNMFAFKNTFFKFLEDYLNKYFKQSDEDILKGEALLPEVVKERLAKKTISLKDVKTTSNWYGITYRDDLEELANNINKMINNGEYPSKLW